MSEITIGTDLVGVPVLVTEAATTLEPRHRRTLWREHLISSLGALPRKITIAAVRQPVQYTTDAQLDRQFAGVPDYAAARFGKQLAAEYETQMTEYSSNESNLNT